MLLELRDSSQCCSILVCCILHAYIQEHCSTGVMLHHVCFAVTALQHRCDVAPHMFCRSSAAADHYVAVWHALKAYHGGPSSPGVLERTVLSQYAVGTA